MFLNWTNEEIWNFDQYNGLASLEKRWFCDLFKSVFYGEERLVFYIERHQTLFLGQISLQRNDKEISNFSSKPWTNPFGKMPNFRFFKWVFLWSRTASFLSRKSPNTFLRPNLTKKKREINMKCFTETMD